ncbi:MAG: hypothetical protein AB1640_18620 [bacterium]
MEGVRLLHPSVGPGEKDPRGWRVDLLEASGQSAESLGDLHVVSLLPGSVRGNHLHPHAREWLLMFGGPARLAWRSGRNGDVQEIAVEGRGPALFEILPGVEHALKNLSDGEIYLVAIREAQSQETTSCPALLTKD